MKYSCSSDMNRAREERTFDLKPSVILPLYSCENTLIRSALTSLAVNLPSLSVLPSKQIQEDVS